MIIFPCSHNRVYLTENKKRKKVTALIVQITAKFQLKKAKASDTFLTAWGSRLLKDLYAAKNYPSKLLNYKFSSFLLIHIRFVSNKVHKHITSLSLETLGSNLPSPRKYNENFVILTVTVESSEIPRWLLVQLIPWMLKIYNPSFTFLKLLSEVLTSLEM